VTVDVTDEETDRPESGKREILGADPRGRRIVLNRRVVIGADGAFDATEVRREIEPETEPRQ
jgi:hypothetical protein